MWNRNEIGTKKCEIFNTKKTNIVHISRHYKWKIFFLDIVEMNARQRKIVIFPY